MGRAARSDAELLAACRRGETEAFGSLVERYQGLVCAVSYSATGDRVLSEDVAQETFLAAWVQLTELREPGKLRGWLCAIARNLGLKALRRSGREVPTAETPVTDDAAPSPLEATLEAESARLVWDSLRRIPDTYREALVLYYQENQSVAEMAAVLGISENAAMQRLSRGRRHLADTVSAVVEHSLGQRKPPRNFAAGIVASLPAARPMSNPSTTETTHGGSSMLKIAALVSAFAAAGGAAYLVTQTSGESESPAVEPGATETAVIAAPRAASERPELAPLPRHPSALAERPSPGDPAPMPEGAYVAPDPDTEPRIGGAALAALERGPSRGPVDAPVTIVLFTDFMCTYCEQVVATVDELFDEYPGKVRLVMKQFPVHEEARLAAEAALAAEDQGKFWELHDMLMTNQQDLSREALITYAGQVGIDVPSFTNALDQRSYRDAVAADQQAGKDISVRGTPAFLINGRLMVGARPIDVFRVEIERELAAL
ncbi:MAG TPA: sigma-70 family RNA polymerase sigma factor [Kofleriaceae bacterium]|nr:sigma-70 family RNA polymerase sigma factor [Kofleriaceae bacterium]